MPEYVSEDSPSLSTLIGGIVEDMQRLIRQEIALARREIKDELIKTRNAGVMFVAGLSFLWIVPVMLAFMFVKLLQLAIPAEWACFAIVAAVFLLVGGGLVAACVYELKQVNVVPPQTAETIRQDFKAISQPGSVR
jgi:hypothetical protein